MPSNNTTQNTQQYESKPPVEAAKDVTLAISTVDGDYELSVANVDTTKEITVEQVRENNVFPIGDAVTEISYSGSMTFKGRRHVIDSYLFDENGLPRRNVALTLTHDDLNPNDPNNPDPFTETWHDLRVVSTGYEMQTGEVTEVSYDWIALGKTPA
ncbi:hypothetical protein [Halorubellus litoreus]|uniref:Uncharacterized protein n=1 Tax=Halorubellus litoreus TaxID=755308 RepID=A0ABD5VEA5_9EURY